MADYSERFRTSAAAEQYDLTVYAEDSRDAFLWSLQRKRLGTLFASMGAGRSNLSCLDFACGTGRVLAELEHWCSHPVGVDISEEMTRRAGVRAGRADIRVGDVIARPELLDGGPYDVITAFRFFLNTEPGMRAPIMKLLAERVARPGGVLVFNSHGNPQSLRHLAIERRRRRGEIHAELSIGEASDLARAAGLEVVEVWGYGLCPDLVYRGRLRWLGQLIDRAGAALRPLAAVSYDVIFICRPAG